MNKKNKKTIYNYCKNTGEFVYNSIARKNPLEKGKFLIPACATDIESPKIGENEVAIFKNNKWIIKKDFRGLKYFDKKGDEFLIKKLGIEPPKDYLKERPIIFEEEKLKLINKRKSYLNSTDWYDIRSINSKKVPKEIKDKREKTREEINKIEKVKTLKDLKKYE